MTKKTKALIVVGMLVFGAYKGFGSLASYAQTTVAKSDCVEFAKTKLGTDNVQAVDAWVKNDGRDTVVKLGLNAGDLYESRICVVDRQSVKIVSKSAEHVWY
jgi:hypothetical protein